MDVRWSREKSAELKRLRGLSFEEILQLTPIGFEAHPARSNQILLYLEVDAYVWVMPCVIEENGIFLKTLYPSRKHTRRWRRGELP